ncbi:UNVERIFIED_CONTAM: hypothetical protein GTU68_048734 [Idotea baltica]|nr:hypothetical protein [Idotea baltica]
MFQKPCRIKTQTQLKGSDKKKLTAEIAQNFPSLTEDDLSALIPSKADVILIKAFCSKGDIVNIYQIQKDPMFFKIDKNDQLYPSVYFLWKFPNFTKTFTTFTNVITKLMQGADLMLPGIIVKGEVNISSYGKFDKGKMVAIDTLENAIPFAIGKTAMSSMDMYMSARQGKGVIVLHIYKDHLWEMGSKAPIPEVSHENQLLGNASVTSDSAVVDVVSLSLQGTEIDDQQNATSEESSKPLGPEDMDELFMHCFLKTLKTSAKKVELPILTSNFYRLQMVNACPSDQALEIKKSSYKKLSKFLNAMAKKNFIEVKEFPKGVENITGINFGHVDVKSFHVDESEVSAIVESKPAASANTFIPPTLEEVYQVSGTTIQFFRRNGLSKGDVLSRTDVRAIVTQYIDRNNLKREGKVEVDPLLHEAVVSPKEGYKEFLDWGEIFSRLLGKMSPAIRISPHGQPCIIRKGKLECIEIAVAKRSGNKKVTLVTTWPLSVSTRTNSLIRSKSE